MVMEMMREKINYVIVIAWRERTVRGKRVMVVVVYRLRGTERCLLLPLVLPLPY